MDLHLFKVKHSQVLNILLSAMLSIILIIAVSFTYKYLYDLSLIANHKYTISILVCNAYIFYIIINKLDFNKEHDNGY